MPENCCVWGGVGAVHDGVRCAQSTLGERRGRHGLVPDHGHKCGQRSMLDHEGVLRAWGVENGHNLDKFSTCSLRVESAQQKPTCALAKMWSRTTKIGKRMKPEYELRVRSSSSSRRV